MGFLNWVENKLIGDLEVEYGAFSADAQGIGVSASLRKHRDGKHYLVVQWGGRGTLRVVDFEVTPAILDRMSSILQDVTKRVSAATPQA